MTVLFKYFAAAVVIGSAVYVMFVFYFTRLDHARRANAARIVLTDDFQKRLVSRTVKWRSAETPESNAGSSTSPTLQDRMAEDVLSSVSIEAYVADSGIRRVVDDIIGELESPRLRTQVTKRSEPPEQIGAG